MDSKLTLKLNEEIIEKAKIYAAERKISLSRLIENYLSSLTSDQKDVSALEISPFVKSLSQGGNILNELDSKEDYQDHLIKKHQ